MLQHSFTYTKDASPTPKSKRSEQIQGNEKKTEGFLGKTSTFEFQSKK